MAEDLSLASIADLGLPTMALLAAHETGLLGAVLDNAALGNAVASDALAGSLGLDATVTRLTLNVLVACGVLAYRDGRYGASAELLARERDAPGGVMLHLRLLRHLPELLVSGKPLLAMDGTLDERAHHYAGVAPGLGNMFAGAAAELAEAVDGETVYDLGAGSGVWSLAFAARRPAVRVTAVDLEPVARKLRANAIALGVESRVTVITGSYFDVEPPDAAFDVVILGNVLHLETPEDAALLVRRAAAALRPRGTVVVLDILGSSDGAGFEPDPSHAMYALFLALRTAHAQMHPRPAVLGWLAAAGLPAVRPLRLPSAPPQLDCLLARRAHP
jgi:SAM-dependent methyltransferase